MTRSPLTISHLPEETSLKINGIFWLEGQSLNRSSTSFVLTCPAERLEGWQVFAEF